MNASKHPSDPQQQAPADNPAAGAYLFAFHRQFCRLTGDPIATVPAGTIFPQYDANPVIPLDVW